MVIHSDPVLVQAYPTAAEANRMCARPAGGIGPGASVEGGP